MSSSCSKSCGSKAFTCGSPNAKKANQEMAIKTTLDKIKNKILVMSGKGGVGKSTVATNLALGLANNGHKVGLMDVDLHGPDICRMLNLSGKLTGDHSTGDLVPTMKFGDNLQVISLEYMMENRDDAIIWRGPLKNQAIRQFISDMDWGHLDYLIIDSPPGTGDEPLSIAQNIKDVNALVVTTPQEVALADVRKSINFCRQLSMQIVGLVENMSGFTCPHCSETVDIFKSGGGEATALQFDIPFLGKAPIDPRVVMGGDDGQPFLASDSDSAATKAFSQVIANVEKKLPPSPAAVQAVNLETIDGCGCGSGPCSTDTCDC